eukprot:7376964-Prymnesium_polylepis.1
MDLGDEATPHGGKVEEEDARHHVDLAERGDHPDGHDHETGGQRILEPTPARWETRLAQRKGRSFVGKRRTTSRSPCPACSRGWACS